MTKRVVEFAAWWAGLVATYLLLLSSVTGAEVLAGVAVAAAVAAAGVAATRPFRAAAGPPRIGWGRLRWLPVDLGRDVGVLTRLLGRQLSSRRRNIGFHDEVALAEHTEAPSVRAYAVLLLSATPGSFVTDVTVRRGEADRLVVHRMCPPARFEAAVQR